MSANDQARGVRFREDNAQPPSISSTANAAEPIAAMDPPPGVVRNNSETSTSSGESDPEAKQHHSSDDDNEGQFQFTPAVVTTPVDEIPSMTNSGSFGWGPARGRGASGSVTSLDATSPPTSLPNGASCNPVRPIRPQAARTPSNAYAPASARRPTQYSLSSVSSRHRNSSATRRSRNPDAAYRAQEKAYVQRIARMLPIPTSTSLNSALLASTILRIPTAMMSLPPPPICTTTSTTRTRSPSTTETKTCSLRWKN